MQPIQPRFLNDNPTTCDIVRILSAATTDTELKELITCINAESELYFSSDFHLKLEVAVVSRDFRKRVFVVKH